MKKYTLLALSLILCAALMVGCACSNGSVGTTPTTTATRPATMPTTVPTTAPTTMPTTEATTMPTTATEDGGMDATGEGETAGDNGVVGEDGTGSTGSVEGRSRRIPSMG